MLENVVASFVVTLLVGLPLSIYAGVIVARYCAFDATLNRARTLILNVEREWVYARLPERVDDPTSPTGKRSVHFSDALSGNRLQWQLMQIGLDLKEQQQWPSATIVDQVAEELEALRVEVVEKATLATTGIVFDATPHIADWHRRLSKVRPVTWVMLKPWPSKRYEHMACISVDETTGGWHEEEPRKK